MKNKIIIKSDASKKSGWGVGLGFDAVLYHEQGTERIKGQKYIEDGIKTSEAEFQAVAHAVEKIYDELEGDVEKYSLVVESDHTGTPDRIENEMEDEHERVFWDFVNEFSSFDVRWISRGQNEVADALAKSALREGYENND